MDQKPSIALIAIILIIGIVLVIGVTIILAAVIAAFVFSMSSSVPTYHTVGLTIKKTMTGDVVITNCGGPDVASLKSLEVSYQPPRAAAINITDDKALDKLRYVGNNLTIQRDAGTPDDPTDDPVTPTHVTVTASFSDALKQVIVASDV